MFPSHPPRLLPRMLALASTAALLTALALMPSLTAAQARGSSPQARGAACSSRSHARHGARACAKPNHGAKTRTHPGKRGHHATPPAHKPKRTATTTHAPALSPALCEDGSAPVAASGSFACADGSEPTCEGGVAPVSSAHGTALLCPATSGEASIAAEAGCEGEGLCAAGSEGSAGEEAPCAPCERPAAQESEG